MLNKPSFSVLSMFTKLVHQNNELLSQLNAGVDSGVDHDPTTSGSWANNKPQFLSKISF